MSRHSATEQGRHSAIAANASANVGQQRPCYIYYGTRSVKARIDLDVPLDEIVSGLSAE